MRALGCICSFWSGSLVFAVGMVGVSCAELPKFGSGECGNGVVDPGEDCDAYAPSNYKCRPPPGLGQCRYECSADANGVRPLCPEYFGCGVDGICRQSSGNFDYSLPFISSPAERILLGDFDGDSRKDILTFGAVDSFATAMSRTLFMSPSGLVEDTFVFSGPIGSSTITDMDGDGRDDLSVSMILGVGVLLGQSDRTLFPVAYPAQFAPPGSHIRAARLNGFQGSQTGEGVLILYSHAHINYVISGSGAPLPLAELPRPVNELAGEPATIHLSGDTKTDCDALLLAYRGRNDISMLRPCDERGQWPSSTKSFSAALALESGHTVKSGVLTADFNGDDVTDLLMDDETNQAWIAFGCGKGQFCSAPGEPSDATVGRASSLAFVLDGRCPSDPLIRSQIPLALADLNGDRHTDAVFSEGIFLTSSVVFDKPTAAVQIRGCWSNRKFVGAWTVATVGDLNRDGLIDVAAASTQEFDVDVLIGTGRDRLNGATIATSGAVSHVLIGDFDGDLVSDLAIAEQGDRRTMSSSLAPDQLSIAFGRLAGIPEPPKHIGQFHEIRQLSSARYDVFDATEDIGVVSNLEQEDGDAISVLIGGARRQFFAPLGLDVFPREGYGLEEIQGRPLAVVPAVLSDSRFKDLGAIGVDAKCLGTQPCPSRLWKIGSIGPARFGLPQPSSPLPKEIQPFQQAQGQGKFALFLRAADLDRDGLDELLVLAPYGADASQTALWISHPPRGKEPWSSESSAINLASKSNYRLIQDSHPTFIDLDADDWPDLIMLVENSTGKHNLVVAWNDGTGLLGLESASIIDVPDEDPVGYALLSDNKYFPDIAVVTRSAVVLIKSVEIREYAIASTEAYSGGRAIAAGDVTGDGVEDLIVAIGRGLHLFPGKAVSP